jgi:hypothetical protein
MENPKENDPIMAALEDAQDLADAIAARQETGAISLDDYVAERDRRRESVTPSPSELASCG